MAKGVDIEAEAVALCWVANVYTSVLKMERTALPTSRARWSRLGTTTTTTGKRNR